MPEGPVTSERRPQADRADAVLSGALDRATDESLAAAAHGVAVVHLSPAKLAWRRFRAHKMAMASVVLLAIIAVLVFFPSLVTEHGPNERLGMEVRQQSPSMEHPFGTNRNQQDMLSRVLHGGQVSLQVGLAVALIAGIVGTAVGGVAAYVGRWVDTVLMRVTDLFLAIPLLVALIVMTRLPEEQAWAETLIGGRGSVRSVISILAAFFWMPIARLVRGELLSLKEKEFIEAARAIGASGPRILVRHLIPNAAGTIVVAVTLAVAAAILTESALSFLGFGVDRVFTPTWGNLLDDARSAPLTGNPFLVYFPGLAILLTVLCVNYIGDGLRDALDPRQRLGAT
ncbi:MAG: ABC transporter permease [Acidimicrobiia bacterium]